MFSQKTSMFEKVDNKAESTKKSPSKLRNKSKIRNWYNQILHLTQDTICKVTKTLENITYKRDQEAILTLLAPLICKRGFFQ